jgi:hypothetical protein
VSGVVHIIDGINADNLNAMHIFYPESSREGGEIDVLIFKPVSSIEGNSTNGIVSVRSPKMIKVLCAFIEDGRIENPVVAKVRVVRVDVPGCLAREIALAGQESQEE